MNSVAKCLIQMVFAIDNVGLKKSLCKKLSALVFGNCDVLLRYVVVLQLVLFPVFLNAETVPYTLERGFVAPNFFEEIGVGKYVSSVFLNPAGFAGKRQKQIAVDASQDFLGYNRYAVALTYPYAYGEFGLGYMSLSADDVAEVPAALNRKAVQTGTLSDSYRLLVANLSVNPRPGLTLGARLGEFRHALADDEAKGYVVDAGLRQQFELGWIGVYSRYLTPLRLTWEKSGEEELVERNWVYEAGFTVFPFTAVVSADDNHRRVYAEWALHKRLTVSADSVWDSGFSSERMSVGTCIDFGSFALSYLHLHYTQTELAADQDVVGLLFRLGDSR